MYGHDYAQSWAVIIGINEFEFASPLSYAVSDAEAVATLLRERFGFLSDRMAVLLDREASKEAILSEVSRLSDLSGADDRVLFFFAGHGHTRRGRRGDVGFLVPSSGSVDALHSLIRWDELTRASELIAAKHALFVMDACYGGLAVTRSPGGGGNRFLKDILGRYSRQVLAAGKADQVVADSGGPRAGNSVFTGHFLEALDGNAANVDGVITANGVMAYVYERVGRDTESMQTPHYGSIDGDGDFVFQAPSSDEFDDDPQRPKDLLIQSIAGVIDAGRSFSVEDLAGEVKELLAEPNQRIRLHELVMTEVKDLLGSTGPDRFPVASGAEVSAESLAERLEAYEEAAARVTAIMPLLGRWCTESNRSILATAVSRLSDNVEAQSGLTLWLGLRWYPVMLALYAGGIGAASGREYANLCSLLNAGVRGRNSDGGVSPVAEAGVRGIYEAIGTGAFKLLPGHERHFVPFSEYTFKLLQPPLEDGLFLGNDYEDCFDRFEVLLALAYGDRNSESSGGWVPPGRFAWKGRRHAQGPLDVLSKEAAEAGRSWGPLAAGLFGGSSDRAKEVIDSVAEFLRHLNWY